MILEAFEIENWSCIGRIAVDGLPPTGVVVLHGPNGTGKSSILEALRACLMDNKSTSKAIGRGFPRDSADKPRVSVTFRAAGASWRITKQFNSRESKLESRTSEGRWKLETADPTEAHERTRQLTGGADSSLGLHQLLWLTQAEFHLPDPKKFDADVQSRLRGVLGVLQTPLDDRFLGRVKGEWSRWFGARSKPGEKPNLKKGSPLDKALAELDRHKADLARIEAEFRVFEAKMERSASLEVSSRDLQRQHDEKTRVRDLLRLEYERSLNRLDAHRFAEERVADAEKRWADALASRRLRAEGEQRLREAESSAATARSDVEDKVRRLRAAEQGLRERRLETQVLHNAGRELQARLNLVGERRQLLALEEQVETARENLRRAEHAAGELDDLKRQAREHPAPDPSTLKRLEENRAKATQLQANLAAAAIALTLIADAGATGPRLVIDGDVSADPGRSADGTPHRLSIRRRAEIAIPGWGRLELTRGSDARSIDQIEADLGALDRSFAEGLAPFGIPAADPSALDRLRGLAADKALRDPEMIRKLEEIDRLAPRGLDESRQAVADLERLVSASDPGMRNGDLPADVGELAKLDARIRQDLRENEERARIAEQREAVAASEIDGNSPADSAMVRGNLRTEMDVAPGLRRGLAEAEGMLASLDALAKARRDELDRMPTAARIDDAVRDGDAALRKARCDLESAKLTESEETIGARLAAADEGLRAIDERLAEARKEFHQIEGALRRSEGLHQKHAAASARVEELARQTDRDRLQSEAYDRLYALFEECREKQLGAVIGPIQDRVLRWMRLLRIGGYQSIRFNDQFLPEALLDGDGATELMLGDESTGTIEQVALMVRLALGSALSTPDEPVVAVLDDPLTHSDVVRLDRMRAVLKNAAAGDPGSSPPAGPLQLLIFTCHPEWFTIDGATTVDLSNPDVLVRRC